MGRCIEKNGFKDAKGRIVIAPQFDFVWDYFDDDLAPVYKDKKFGYIDKKGNVVVPFVYDYAECFGDFHGEPSLALVNIGDTIWRNIGPGARSLMGLNPGLTGVINKKGEIIFPIKCTFIGLFGSDIAPFTMSADVRHVGYSNLYEGLFGFFDKQGKVVVEPKYDIIDFFPLNGGRYFAVGIKGNFGIIDQSGKEVVELKYSRDEAVKRLEAL